MSGDREATARLRAELIDAALVDDRSMHAATVAGLLASTHAVVVESGAVAVSIPAAGGDPRETVRLLTPVVGPDRVRSSVLGVRVAGADALRLLAFAGMVTRSGRVTSLSTGPWRERRFDAAVARGAVIATGSVRGGSVHVADQPQATALRIRRSARAPRFDGSGSVVAGAGARRWIAALGAPSAAELIPVAGPAPALVEANAERHRASRDVTVALARLAAEHPSPHIDADRRAVIAARLAMPDATLSELAAALPGGWDASGVRRRLLSLQQVVGD